MMIWWTILLGPWKINSR